MVPKLRLNPGAEVLGKNKNKCSFFAAFSHSEQFDDKWRDVEKDGKIMKKCNNKRERKDIFSSVKLSY